MAITLRAVGSSASHGASPRTISTTGIVAGDLVQLQVSFSDDIAPSSLPSGFVLVPGAEVTGVNNIRIYSKIATGSEPATYDVTFASGTGFIDWIALYSDTGQVLSLDDLAVQTNASGDRLWPTVTAAAAGAWLLCYALVAASVNSAPHAGMTEDWDAGGPHGYCMHQALVASGATGTRTATGTAATSKTISLLLIETPPPPSALVATAISASSIGLVWSDDSTTETGFRVERSADGISGWSEIATPAANVESYTDTGLAERTTYYYRVKSYGAGGDSAPSATASATTLRNFVHATPEMHTYFYSAPAIFKAKTNMPSVTFPVTALVFDTVTLGAYTDIAADQTLLLGTAEGLDDLGRVRTQNIATSTTIPVGRVSAGDGDGTLLVADNMFITVLDDCRVWSKLPYEAPDGTAYKDADVAVLDYNVEIPPVAVMGADFADYIDPITGLITVAFDGSPSYAMADGATIVTYAWTIGDGTLTVGTLSSAAITATFPAGTRYVSLSVFDSNTKGHTTRRLVVGIDPDADVTTLVTIESWNITPSGTTIGFGIPADMPRSSVPDGAKVLHWWGAPSSPSDRSHIKFVGWHQSDGVSTRATKFGLERRTVLNCVDVAGRLDTLPGFPQALERNSEETHWVMMPGLTISKCLFYLLHWHSTALVVADFTLPPTGDDYPSMRLDSVTLTSLYDQVNSRSMSMVPDHHFVCNEQGQLGFVADWMLKAIVDRPALTDILEEDAYGDFSTDYKPHPTHHVLRSGAVVSSTTWTTDAFGNDTLPLVFCIAPGDQAFGQGVSEAAEPEGLTLSQEALNISEGHRFARLNARYGQWRLTLPHLDFWDFHPATLPRLQLNISATTAAQRGLDTTTPVFMVKSIDPGVSSGEKGVSVRPTLVLERETYGPPAQTHIPPETGDVPDYETPPPPVPTVPPEAGLREGVEVVAGVGLDGFIYRTSDFQTLSGVGGPTWTRVDTTIADTIYSFVVDPFSPGYIGGVGAINGWIANDTAIYRVADLFGSATATAVFAFATATVGASFHWRTIQASFGGYFAEGSNPWLLCVSYYGDTVGHTGTWATYSLDGGVTWATEVQISAAYDSGTPTRFNPIAVWTSPRTPAKAYTAAYYETGDPAPADGYVTLDWGATWTRLSEALVDNPLEPLPDMHFFADNTTVPDLPEQLYTQRGRSYVVGRTATEIYNHTIFLIPPADAVSIKVQHSCVLVETVDPGAGATSDYTMDLPSFVTADGIVTDPILTFTRDISQTEWPGNRDQLGDVGQVRDDYIHFNVAAHAVHVGAAVATISINHLVRVLEITLENGLTYVPPIGAGIVQPGDAFAGTIHIPWNANSTEQLIYFGNVALGALREFRLWQTDAGVTSDISPTDGTRSYGVNRGPFAARAFDSGRQYLLLAGIGNDTSFDPDEDKHAVYVSSDYGATWTPVVAPMADSGAPAGRPAFEAAFGGDVGGEQILFVWGAPNFIKYSEDMGVTLLDKVGNLASFGTTSWCGIAGGPNA